MNLEKQLKKKQFSSNKCFIWGGKANNAVEIKLILNTLLFIPLETFLIKGTFLLPQYADDTLLYSSINPDQTELVKHGLFNEPIKNIQII